MKILLFDAANTLIHKPSIWMKIQEVLDKHQFFVEIQELKLRHKTLSEVIDFPDKTSRDFYMQFNAELLLSLGIIPTDELLDEIFNNCTYQPWEPFEDCEFLKELNIKKAILSNFNSSLVGLIEQLIGKNIFDEIIISENENCRKPSLEFYKIAINRLKTEPEDILYIGDSLKLDLIPAKKMGIKTVLIDRDNIYKSSKERISNFRELNNYI